MAKRTCTKPGCEEPHRSKGLCGKHYREARAERLAQEQCKAEGCSNPRGETGGYCPGCYQRNLAYGDPNAGPPQRRAHTGRPRQAPSTAYSVNHRMVRKARGPAWQQDCAHCGGAACDWATIHGRSGEQPEDYLPLCRSCHLTYDGAVTRLPDNTGRKRSAESRERSRQAALARWAAPGAREAMSEISRRREARKRAGVTADGSQGHHDGG